MIYPFFKEISALSVLLFLSFNFQAAPVLAQNQPKHIDRCSQAECSHFIVFSATQGDIPGHAFVGWGQENAQTQSSEFQAWGLYPKALNSKIGFGSVPGEIRDDWMSSTSSGHVLVVRVDRNVWESTLVYKDIVQEGEFDLGTDYNLYLRNCTHFAGEVATGIGLNIPGGLQHPKQFISNLKSMNN